MNQFRPRCAAVLLSLVFSACSSPHGQPRENSEAVVPSGILEFTTLYAENCAGCHGAQGRGGPALALADPVYLAIIDEPAMRKIVANGVHGTSMPAFAQNAGGMLTEEQVDVISKGVFSRWAEKGTLDGIDKPSYAARNSATPGNGELVYRTYCASCHGPGGQGGPKGSAITNDSFLALVSDQELRTITIVGRPDLGAPDWRGNVPGRPMSDQEITDVVAWLASHRVQSPGQPYSVAHNAQQ